MSLPRFKDLLVSKKAGGKPGRSFTEVSKPGNRLVIQCGNGTSRINGWFNGNSSINGGVSIARGWPQKVPPKDHPKRHSSSNQIPNISSKYPPIKIYQPINIYHYKASSKIIQKSTHPSTNPPKIHQPGPGRRQGLLPQRGRPAGGQRCADGRAAQGDGWDIMGMVGRLEWVGTSSF